MNGEDHFSVSPSGAARHLPMNGEDQASIRVGLPRLRGSTRRSRGMGLSGVLRKAPQYFGSAPPALRATSP